MSLKGINAYKKGNLKQDVANADPHKLTLMLLQGALDRIAYAKGCLLYTSPSPRDRQKSRMPSSA